MASNGGERKLDGAVREREAAMAEKSREERGAATRMRGDFYACFTCFFFARILCKFSQNLPLFSLFLLFTVT